MFPLLVRMRNNNIKLWKMWQMIVGIVRQFCQIIRVLVSWAWLQGVTRPWSESLLGNAHHCENGCTAKSRSDFPHPSHSSRNTCHKSLIVEIYSFNATQCSWPSFSEAISITRKYSKRARKSDVFGWKLVRNFHIFFTDQNEEQWHKAR